VEVSIGLRLYAPHNLNPNNYQMPIITNIKVRISMIKVDRRYYSFNYNIWVNGKLKHKSNFSGSHEWDNEQDFKSHLQQGYATRLALEMINDIKLPQ
jgi:hypothetical protein